MKGALSSFAARVASVSLAALLLAGLVAPIASREQAHAADGSSADQVVELGIDRLSPKVAREGDTLLISGTLRNISSEKVVGVTIELRSSARRITTRYELAQDSDPANKVGFLVPSTWQRVGSVDPGESVYWSISIPLRELRLPSSPDQFGAYPIAVESAFVDGDGHGRVTRLPTTLMWVPEHAEFKPTQVSWLWPLVGGIHRGFGTAFLNDDLATALSPTGRLGRLVQLAADAGQPLTYAVDPALVDDATAMAASAKPTGGPAASKPGDSSSPPAASEPAAPPTPASASPKSSPTSAKSGNSSASGSPTPAPYSVLDDEKPGHVKPGAGAEVAAAWLEQLKGAVATPGSAVIALPYGDADVVALERAGLAKDIALARYTGESLLTGDLGPVTLPGVVWPINSTINERTLDDLAGENVTTVVLTDADLKPIDPNAVATPRATLQTASGPIDAVLSDSLLNSLIADPHSIAGGPRLAEQRFLAETMMITEQRPGAGSSIVLIPPRDADPEANPSLRVMLEDSGSVPWLTMVGLDKVIAQPPDNTARQPLDYSKDALQAELSQAALAPIPELREDLSTFSAVLGTNSDEPLLKSASLALLRAESSWWRSNPAGSLQITAAVRKSLTAHTDQVFISNPRLITMTSRKQKIPLTVVNNLPDPVTLQLRLTAVNAPRLTVTPTEPFTVPGKGNRHEVLVEVEATTSGRFQVEAQLMTAESEPRPFGAPVSFELNSTAYGAVALAIAGGAAALLFALSGIRLFRRWRRRNGGGGDSTDSPANGGPAADSPAGMDADSHVLQPASDSSL